MVTVLSTPGFGIRRSEFTGRLPGPGEGTRKLKYSSLWRISGCIGPSAASRPAMAHAPRVHHRAGIAVLACTQRPMGVGPTPMGDPSAALVGAPDLNSALPSTLCGMRKHTLPHDRTAMPVGLWPI